MTALVIRGDARHLPLPDESVDLIVTSPPYFALRSYSDVLDCLKCYEMRLNGRDPRQAWPDYAAHVRDVHERRHYPGQIGSEPTPQEFLEALWECTAEMMRVLKPSGSAFVNLGDKYAAGHGGSSTEGKGVNLTVYRNREAAQHWAGEDSHPSQSRSVVVPGTRPKSLMLLPERYRIGCVDRLGLIARAVIVWSKVNGLPESVTDRVRRSHEDWVHLTKQPRYYSAVDEIREPSDATNPRERYGRKHAADGWTRLEMRGDDHGAMNRPGFATNNPLGKLPGSVWTIEDESSLARLVLEAVKGGSLSLDEGERIWTGRPAYGQRSSAILTGAGNGPGASTGTATDDTGKPPKATDEHTDSSTNSPSGSSPMDSLSTTSATTQTPTASEASPAHIADASIQHTLSQSPSQPTSHDEPGKTTAPQDISTTNATPTSVLAESASAEPVWLREAANIAEHTAPPSVWKVATEPLTVPDHLGIDHFAAYPTEWPKRWIRGWSPPGICLECGEGRRPATDLRYRSVGDKFAGGTATAGRHRSGIRMGDGALATILGYVCACCPHTDHPGTGLGVAARTGDARAVDPGNAPRSSTRVGNAPTTGAWREYHFDRWTPAPTRPAIVLDPFSGTGTTALVASALGRIGIAVDLSHDYGRLAQWRTTDRAQIAKVLEVPKPPVIPKTQLGFDFGDAS